MSRFQRPQFKRGFFSRRSQMLKQSESQSESLVRRLTAISKQSNNQVAQFLREDKQYITLEKRTIPRLYKNLRRMLMLCKGNLRIGRIKAASENLTSAITSLNSMLRARSQAIVLDQNGMITLRKHMTLMQEIDQIIVALTNMTQQRQRMRKQRF